MKTYVAALALASAIGFASSAQATITVDGVLDAAYGAATAVVTANPAANTSNFGQDAAHLPGSENATGYSIYLSSDASNIYGFLQADAVPANFFANLYFDVYHANGPGSDVGFEITNSRGFIPGTPGYQPVPINFATTATGVEFSIANAYVMGPDIAVGDQIYLRLSQSFGYSVAGGASYGPNGLGAITIGGAVPEPATWAMLIAGFGLVGAAMRRKRRTAVAYA